MSKSSVTVFFVVCALACTESASDEESSQGDGGAEGCTRDCRDGSFTLPFPRDAGGEDASSSMDAAASPDASPTDAAADAEAQPVVPTMAEYCDAVGRRYADHLVGCYGGDYSPEDHVQTARLRCAAPRAWTRSPAAHRDATRWPRAFFVTGRAWRATSTGA